MTDLRRELKLASVDSPRVLVMFDLDGFKRYNDTYGHPAGDALLTRLGANLGRAIQPYGSAYRLGGDEFCVLVDDRRVEREDDHRARGRRAVRAGRGLLGQSSHGAVILPHEARDATLALQDRRPAHVRAEGGPPLLGHAPDARHPASGPAASASPSSATT